MNSWVWKFMKLYMHLQYEACIYIMQKNSCKLDTAFLYIQNKKISKTKQNI